MKAQPESDRDVTAGVARIWEDRKASVVGRIAALDTAAAALGAGRLGEEERRRAEGEAHKLAGSTGMFGFPVASELAREIECLLADAPSPSESGRLAALAVLLRRELESPPAPDARR